MTIPVMCSRLGGEVLYWAMKPKEEFMSKWMTADWTVGQLNALVKLLGGEKVARGILDGTIKFAVTARAREFLRPAGEITLPATQGVDPNQYFQTRKGLYVWQEFSERIVSVATQTELSEITLQAFNLVKSANDTEIRSELPEDHVFGAEELCGYLPELLARQPNGEEDDLLTNSYANIFYVRGKSGAVFAVNVGWRSFFRSWDVGAFRLGDVRWDEGNRVVSRATA